MDLWSDVRYATSNWILFWTEFKWFIQEIYRGNAAPFWWPVREKGACPNQSAEDSCERDPQTLLRRFLLSGPLNLLHRVSLPLSVFQCIFISKTFRIFDFQWSISQRENGLGSLFGWDWFWRYFETVGCASRAAFNFSLLLLIFGHVFIFDLLVIALTIWQCKHV